MRKITNVIRTISAAAAAIAFLIGFGILGNLDTGAMDQAQGIAQVTAALAACVICVLIAAATCIRREALEE